MDELIRRLAATDLSAETVRVGVRLLALCDERGHGRMGWDEFMALLGVTNAGNARRYLTSLRKAGVLGYRTDGYVEWWIDAHVAARDAHVAARGDGAGQGDAHVAARDAHVAARGDGAGQGDAHVAARDAHVAARDAHVAARFASSCYIQLQQVRGTGLNISERTLATWLETHSMAAILEAVRLALAAEAQRPAQYAAGILRNWERDGYPSGVQRLLTVDARTDPSTWSPPEQPVETPAAVAEPVDERAAAMWDQCLKELQLQLAQSTFVLYLYGSRVVSLSDGVLVVEVMDRYGREWLQARLSGMVQRILRNISGEALTVQWAVRGRV